MKKTNTKGSSSGGYFRNQFRQNLITSNKENHPPDVEVNEKIFNTIREVFSMPESSSNQESNDQEKRNIIQKVRVNLIGNNNH